MNGHHYISSMLVALLCTGQSMAQSGKPDTVSLQVKNEAAINQPGLEFSPQFFEDGIVFISTNSVGLKKNKDQRLNLPAMSILRSQRDSEGALQAPQPFAKELSSLNHEGPVTFDRTTETIYFSTNAVEKGREKIAKDDIQKTRIYSSKKNGAVWTDPEPLPFNNNEFDDLHPTISIDGDKLFFASNRPGGQGGMDIYVTYRVGESWSEPVNLGPGINTAGNEAFPFIHADNTLYYASDALEGKGGLDMYYVVPEGTNWTKPVNLGAPFNTAGDDFGLIVDLDKINGYYSSNGAGGAGSDDIFSFHTENGNLDDYLLQNFRVPDRNLAVRVIATDKTSGAAVSDASVRVLQYDVNTVIGRDEFGNLITIQKENGQDVMRVAQPDKGIVGATDFNGTFNSELKPGSYAFTVSKQGYKSKQVRASINKPANEVSVQMERDENDGKVHWNASVFNYVTNAPLAGSVLVLKNKATGAMDTIVADANGSIDYYLMPDSKYDLALYQGGKKIGDTEITTEGWSLPNQIMMQVINVGTTLSGTVIELPNIYYNFNDATLRPDARKDLFLVLALLKQHSNVTIELASHTDSRGTNAYNQELSQRRANGVVEFLEKQGVSRSRMKPVGYGETRLRNNCKDGVSCTEDEHARNRRTEVVIKSSDVSGTTIYVTDQNEDKANINQAPPSTIATPPVETKEDIAPATPAPVVTPPAGTQEFYVVVGSFLAETGAQTKLAAVQGKGYTTAEIVRFPESPYYSVIVGRFADKKEADSKKKQLSGDKIEAFVKASQKTR
ncbi:MAG: OmpA family protein [Saprospiraceae bacterium]|nr:OmpA family protein [Saprospiraceae bacterium]